MFRAIANPSVEKVTGVVLNLVGYDWDSLLKLVQEAIGPKNYAILAKVFGQLGEAVDKGLEVYVGEKITELKAQAEELKQTVPEFLQGVVTALITQVALSLGQAVATHLVSLLSPVGWLGQLVRAVYQGIMFIFKNFGRITDLIGQFVAVMRGAIEGMAAGEVAAKVEKLLAGAVRPVLDAFARLASPGDLPDKIKRVLSTVKELAQQPAIAVLTVLAKPIRAAFEKVLKELGLGDKEPVIDPIAFGPEKKRRLFVTADGRVWQRASPTVDVIPWLEKQGSNEAKTALEAARQLSTDARKVTAETRKTQTTGTVKAARNATEAAVEDQAKLATLLEKIPVGCAAGGVSESSPCDLLRIPKTGSKKDRHQINATKNVHVFDDRPKATSATGGQFIDVSVVETAFVALVPGDIDTGSNTDNYAKEWTQCVVGVKKDDAGHVISNALGGSGKLKDGNIFPINYSINRGEQSKLETRIKALVNTNGNDVCVAILLNYGASDPDFPGRPSSVAIKVYCNGVMVDGIAYDNVYSGNPYDPVPGRPNRCSDEYGSRRRKK